MVIWSSEKKELEKLYQSLEGKLPGLEKELQSLINSDDENVVLLYSRRCLEVIITDLCECELKRPRKTEPLKGIIDKLHKEEKVPSNIITSMDHLNSLSAYGAHPKDFDPEQVKPALNNLAIILKWYLKYEGIAFLSKPSTSEEDVIKGIGKLAPEAAKLEKSIAILPFKNDSKDEENTYFINGLMEEILNNLQKIKDLRVISRTSVEQYRNQTKPIHEIAKELGVNYIVEGSGQKYGNSFRLRIQLIMAAKESHLWGESYQQEINDVKDIFKIQSQIAESIAKELKSVITPQEKNLIEKTPTKILAAYDNYLKGRFHVYKTSPEDLEKALRYFELAKETDPNFALSYAGIAQAWILRQQFGMASPEEAGQKIMEAVEIALELDNTLADVHSTVGAMNVLVMWDWVAGENALKKAIEINPNHVEAHLIYTQLLIMLGEKEKAVEHIELTLKLDPYNPVIKVNYSMYLLFVRRYDDCISTSREVFKENPSLIIVLDPLFNALHMEGKYEEAFETMKICWSNIYKDHDHVFDQYEKLGYAETLNLEADTLMAQSTKKYVAPGDLAIIYMHAGNKEKTLDCLEQAYKIRDPNIPYTGIRPIYGLLRDEPRYQELLKKLNLPDNN